jgi:hypothetical protein
MSFQQKYLKYKNKYLDLKNLVGGSTRSDANNQVVGSGSNNEPEQVVNTNPNTVANANPIVVANANPVVVANANPVVNNDPDYECPFCKNTCQCPSCNGYPNWGGCGGCREGCRNYQK